MAETNCLEQALRTNDVNAMLQIIASGKTGSHTIKIVTWAIRNCNSVILRELGQNERDLDQDLDQIVDLVIWREWAAVYGVKSMPCSW